MSIFLSVDPDPGGSANAYDYCDQDPINCSDINGESVRSDLLGDISYAGFMRTLAAFEGNASELAYWSAHTTTLERAYNAYVYHHSRSEAIAILVAGGAFDDPIHSSGGFLSSLGDAVGFEFNLVGSRIDQALKVLSNGSSILQGCEETGLGGAIGGLYVGAFIGPLGAGSGAVVGAVGGCVVGADLGFIFGGDF